MGGALVSGLGTTDALAAVFSDDALISAMTAFEVALARAEAAAGLVPERVALATAEAARGHTFDISALVEGQRRSGTAVIPFVEALTDAVHRMDPDSARYVHWGATSQDVADTAILLCLKRAREILGADHAALVDALRALADRHATTPMLARTLLQPAPPIPFGLKVAGWVGELERCWLRLSDAFDEGLVLQFGGASGTLASLGSAGPTIAAALARELDLGDPGAPWHAHRDRLAAIVAACGIYTGALGKLARDVSLLMQFEVAEVFETGGGSSTMPHKRNPARSAVVLAAALRMPGLVASFLGGLVHEHERAAGPWHAEAPTLVAVVETMGAALSAALGVVGGLSVDGARMRSNIAATHGAVFAERAMMLAGGKLGRQVAHRLVSDAVRESQRTGEGLDAVIRRHSELASAIGPEGLEHLLRPDDYLGSAEAFRRRLLTNVP
jgi:3-carboxy-cis,cis-muconate cycloisomerase